MKIHSFTLILFFFPLLGEGAIIFREIVGGEISDNTGTVLLNNIDLDRDGVVDFFTTSAGNQATIVPTGNNRVLSIVATLPDLGRSVIALTEGQVITENPSDPLSWNGLDDRVNELDSGGSVLYMCNGRVPIGQPVVCNSKLFSQGTSYIGLEFEKEGETRYGWVAIGPQISVIHNTQVLSWAYETTPDMAIFSGAIPEPSSSALLLGGMLGLTLRRKRSLLNR